jgi:tetratricopeptide (TPR) repeat protein
MQSASLPSLSDSLFSCVSVTVAFGGNTLPDEIRYRAFISYSHADKGIARTLHRRLEAYRLPKHLVGSDSRFGPVPARLTPIFRDIDELPASTDLSAEIKAALAASDALILLCSPQAKASQWVAREIALFQELHGTDRPIFCAVVAGDPQTVLPALLMAQSDPIAADFRKGQDGSNLALMKLVSGLTGVSLAALVQRDAQRRMRRVMAVTAIAAAVMLLLTSALFFAQRARAEAERNRNEAEGLIEYMLTDLRERLKGVGRLDVMAAVNARAMDYYSKQGALDDLPPDALKKRARILHAMGEDDANGGKFGPALEKFTAAHQTTTAILALRPNDPDAVFAHAQSEYWVGRAAAQRGDRATALRHWQNYLTQAKRLSDIEPNTPKSLMELGYAHGNLCELNTFRNADLKAATAECAQSVGFVARALRLAPADLKIAETLANRHGWMARILAAQGRFGEALAQRTLEREALNRMISADNKNINYALRLLWQEQGVAEIYGEMGRRKEARAIVANVLVKTERILSELPGRGDIMEYKMRMLILLAELERPDPGSDWRKTVTKIENFLPRLKSVLGSPQRVEGFYKAIQRIKEGNTK